MSENRTLIAYVTKGGVTEETTSIIANILQENYGLSVDLVNLKKAPSPDLTQYQNIILGSGVRMQRVYNEAVKFLENDLEDKRFLMFVVSNEAGNPESYDQAVTKYIKNPLANHPNIEPVATEAFGGRMKILGITISDTTDTDKVEAWADKIGKKLTK